MGLSHKQQQALDAILERSSIDMDFRRQLLLDPRRAINEQFGVFIPPNFRVRFVERDPSVDALVVLPDFKTQNGELGEHDLECVSGGGDGDPTWATGGGTSTQRGGGVNPGGTGGDDPTWGG